MTFKLLLAPGARKKSTLVSLGLEVNFENPRQLGFVKDHMGKGPLPCVALAGELT